jgi:hypothetical protein
MVIETEWRKEDYLAEKNITTSFGYIFRLVITNPSQSCSVYIGSTLYSNNMVNNCFTKILAS